MRTEKPPTALIGTTKRRPRVALRVAATAAVIALPLAAFAGVTSQASANTTRASTVASLKQSVAVGFVARGATNTFTVDVPTSGDWKLDFGVSYPDTPGRVQSAVDGHALPEVVSKVAKGTFMTNAYTTCFTLTKGKHNITVTAAQLPSTLPLMVTLVDAATPVS